jgi:YrbI family 3-deoxy-D-manno-octulosonate 8-phosphate phosphatase
MAAVDLVVFDFDGVFTDNRVLVAEDGSEAVFCNRSDGLGVVNLRRSGVACLVLSLETNPVVARRCEKLGLPFVQGCADKWGALKAILDERKMDPSRVAYVGNDVNDLLCLENVGLAICVADAYPEVKAVARYVTKKRGGEGAVREVCDLVITARRVRARRRSA